MDVYEDPDAENDNRVNDLLAQMTVHEKMQSLHEVTPAISRLVITKCDHGNEALHGVVRPGKFTVFPMAIALAAKWNPDLIFNVSTAISDEARSCWNELEQWKLQLTKYSDLLTFWSPAVNMVRDYPSELGPFHLAEAIPLPVSFYEEIRLEEGYSLDSFLSGHLFRSVSLLLSMKIFSTFRVRNCC